jgi:lipoprotein-anchoring transpeptidase ErfK/SrfK
VRVATAIATAVVLAAAIAGCGGDDPARFVDDKGQAQPSAPAQPTAPAVPFSFAITPAGSVTKPLPVSTEIGTKVSGGEVTDVTLVPVGGKAVKGALRDDKTSWVPDQPLKYDTRYTATVTAKSADGAKIETKTASFTTRGRGGSEIGSGMYLFDGKTYGVGMPVVVEFIPGIPKKDRAAVQRRMFVKSDPPQPGTWFWVDNGTQAYYRAPQFWQPGTTLTVRIALEGIPLSNGRYGNEDRRAASKIGDKFEMKVDNKTKKMTVFENDKPIKTFPVSLGKKSTPSSSGTMVVMDKQETTVFDTFAELGPSEGYRTEIAFAQRLTWGGEFIHSAPWSVGDQGVRNVSHGCVNLAPANARWLYSRTKIGDPVTVKGTERKLVPGNGWTAWNMTWEQFVKGSALPVPADLAKTGTTGATPEPTPSA